MSEFSGFIGPSNTQASRWSDAERTLSGYVRIVDAGTPKAKSNMYRRPGLRRFCTLQHGPVSTIFAQDGRCFAVGGKGFFEILPSGVSVAWGAVETAQIAASICSNGKQGHQLFIVSGAAGFIFDLVTNTLTRIPIDPFPDNVIMGCFFNGAFLALSGKDGSFSVSALYDGTSWNALDKGIESQFSDQIIAFVRSHDNLILFGSRNTAIWVDDGSGGAAGFVPQPGTIIEHGIVAPYSVVEVDNTCYYLGQDAQGSRMVWKLDGYTPTRVSTHAFEAAIARVAIPFNAVGWSYQEQGHSFYVLYVPGMPTTWVYDISTEQWHERDHWDTRIGQSVPYVGVNHAFVFGRHLVGDRSSGTVYEQDMAYFDDRLVL